MTLLVLDAADCLEENLRYHRAQGVDFFVAADNGSTDGSLDILERYERAGLVTFERVTGSQREIWSAGRTRTARIAHERGADWVIHNDQDEFWWSVTGDLKETLAAIPEAYGMVVAPRTEFPARPGDGAFAERMTVRESRFLHPPKVAHRTHPQVVLDHPHPTRVWIDDGSSADPFSGRPGLDVAEEAHAARIDDPIVFAPTFPTRVMHFPVRSLEQYVERVRRAERSGLLEGKAREDVRAALEEGRLEDLYAGIALDDKQVARGVAGGWLVEDTDFRDYLRACPDPVRQDGADPPPGSRAWSEERRQRELEELRFDAMYGLTRYVRRRGRTGGGGGGRGALKDSLRKAKRSERHARRRLEEVTRERDQLRRLVEDSGGRQTPWWRARPRLLRRRRG